MSKKTNAKSNNKVNRPKVTPKKTSVTKKSQFTKKSNTKTTDKKNGLFKNLLPSLILSITISFMFFIYEPITMYATNPNDFWFDIYTIIPIIILFAFIFSICIFISLLFCYVIFYHLFKKRDIYYIVITVIFGIFLVTYLQGNFFSGSLPIVYGDPFNWHEFKADSIVSIGLWTVTAIIFSVALIKFKPPKVFSIIPFITSAIFIMLGVSLVSTIITTDALKGKEIYTYTYNNFDLASKNQNLFILLVDAIDARIFTDIMNNKENSDQLFKDFTFYKDTLSFYPFTRDTLPYIFNPVPNHNETSFLQYSKKTFSESKFFKSLKDDSFHMNYFDHHCFMNLETAKDFQNVVSNTEIKPKLFLKQIIKYDLFKYLPYPLKNKARIENLDFSSTKKEESFEAFNYRNIHNYQKIKTTPINTTDNKIFHFIYTEGAHVPFNLDENMGSLPDNNGTYRQKVSATYLLIEAFLNRLKNYDVYDNSAIVIMADHGYGGINNERFNPILFIKGVNESHNKMDISDKPIAFSDLEEAFIQLSKKESTTNLFKNISYPRTRIVLHATYGEEDHIVEYQTDSKAWESEKIVPTGNVYDLK